MTDFVNTIDLLGDEVTGNALVRRTITEFTDNVLKTIGHSAFAYCSALTSVDLPSVTSIGAMAFNTCSSLTIVKLSDVTSIGANAFAWCSALTTIIARSATVIPLSSTSVLTQTPFASGKSGGTVYVPQALIESYQTATNWSTLYAAGTCNFVAIEGSEYE